MGRSLLVMCLLLTVEVHAATGSVVYGSWMNEVFAQQQRAQLVESGIPAHLEEVDVGGQRYYRLLSAVLPEDDARRLAADARRQGYPGAWYLSRVAPPTRSASTAPLEPAAALEPRRSA